MCCDRGRSICQPRREKDAKGGNHTHSTSLRIDVYHILAVKHCIRVIELESVLMRKSEVIILVNIFFPVDLKERIRSVTRHRSGGDTREEERARGVPSTSPGRTPSRRSGQALALHPIFRRPKSCTCLPLHDQHLSQYRKK